MSNIEDNHTTRIPKLRIPEFTGEWMERMLGDSFEERIEKNRGNLPLLSLGEEGLTLQSETQRKDNSNSDKSKYLRVAVGDIAYNTMRMWQGRCVYCNIEGIVSPAYTVCIPNDDVDPMFHYYLFKTQQMIDIFHRNSQGLVSDTLGLKYQALSRIKYLIPPSKEEQKKIAELLCSVDDVIAAENDRLTALKDHKKGLMQQLFPQKDQTQPSKRFPGFNGEWSYVNGNVLFEAISNKGRNSDLPILALTQDQGAVPRDLINYSVQVSEKSVEGYKVVEKDDFIISLRSFQGGIEYSRYKGLCSPAYIVLRKKCNDVVSDFFRFYFKSYNYIQQLNKNLEGIRDGKMISFKQFSEIQIPLPSLTEQKKIAECLTSLDDEILAQQQKVDALKEHKRGLMQIIFPTIK